MFQKARRQILPQSTLQQDIWRHLLLENCKMVILYLNLVTVTETEVNIPRKIWKVIFFLDILLYTFLDLRNPGKWFIICLTDFSKQLFKDTYFSCSVLLPELFLHLDLCAQLGRGDCSRNRHRLCVNSHRPWSRIDRWIDTWSTSSE